MKASFAGLLSIALLCAAQAHAANTYLIESDRTLATIEFKRFGVSSVTARFEKIGGTIALDRDKHEVKIDISIDVNSAVTGSASLDARLKSRAFLDAAKYPNITFGSTSGQFTDGRLTSLSGELTIHGVTRQVAFDVSGFLCDEERRDDPAAPNCEANAQLAIKRSDYGVSKLIPLVSDRILIRFQVHSVHEAAEAAVASLTPQRN